MLVSKCEVLNLFYLAAGILILAAGVFFIFRTRLKTGDSFGLVFCFLGNETP